MLVESLKEKGRYKELIRVYVPADPHGARRRRRCAQGLIEAAREAYADRPDLDALLEKSGVLGGATPWISPTRPRRLESFLRLEPGTLRLPQVAAGAWARSSSTSPSAAAASSTSATEPGHEMDRRGRRGATRAPRRQGHPRARHVGSQGPAQVGLARTPLEMMRQVLNRFSGSARLRHVKDALVPDAVATSRWSTWWKEARKLAHLDPRFHVGGGRDPRDRVPRRRGRGLPLAGGPLLQGLRHRARIASSAAREFARDGQGRPRGPGDAGRARDRRAREGDHRRDRAGVGPRRHGRGGRRRARELREAVDAAPDEGVLLRSIKDDDVRSAAARVLIESGESGATHRLRHDPGRGRPRPGQRGGGPLRLRRPSRVPAPAPRSRRRQAGAAAQPLRLVRPRAAPPPLGRTRPTSPTPSSTACSRCSTPSSTASRRDGERPRQARRLGPGRHPDHQECARSCARPPRPPTSQGARTSSWCSSRTAASRDAQLIRTQDMILRVRPDALKEKKAVAVEEGEVAVGERLDRIYMTPDGMERLRKQRDRILNEEMPANAKEIARAREFGDLSENAEYHAAREKQCLLQAKADAMNGELARARAADARHRQHGRRVRGHARAPQGRRRARDQLHPSRAARRGREAGHHQLPDAARRRP